MKTLFCLLCFLWSSCCLSIEQAQVKAYGHWPIGFPISHVAVLPKLNKNLESLDYPEANGDHPDGSDGFSPAWELGLTVGTGLTALAPALVGLNFWW
ncbi:hypothetical protein [Marinicella meishanensis]|uniref:hypothetical protein n=1 Tax=Marinicella meishanensis TaxID=2873263 RepID=UPI001CC07A54|nr:hypothetical protein [Marinicella sp. NBU2979]